MNWVYRHEPSDEPTRLQSFRMREFIRVGKPDDVVAWRDAWLLRGLELLRGLGLPAQSDVASDPFFGRAGKMMAANQVDQRLKFEILVPVISEENPQRSAHSTGTRTISVPSLAFAMRMNLLRTQPAWDLVLSVSLLH
jgi:hypothetical protein